MEAILPYLRFLQDYEFVIYATLGAVGVFYFFKLTASWRNWQGTVFGIERELALGHFKATLNVLILLILFALLEFALVSFVAPAYPQVSALSTPTLDVLATPTVTLAATIDIFSVHLEATQTPTPALVVQQAEGCIAGKIEWVTPKAGDEISGTVQLMGTVNVPNLGFYKYEYASVTDNVWNSIAANKEPKVNGEIGFWNTSQLNPGDYLLRLMVYDNTNKAFPACVVRIRIARKS